MLNTTLFNNYGSKNIISYLVYSKYVFKRTFILTKKGAQFGIYSNFKTEPILLAVARNLSIIISQNPGNVLVF